MADPILEFDPSAEASGSPLTITTGNYGLTQFSAPAPPIKVQWAGSVDTEGSRPAGDPKHENRTITIGLEVTGATALADLQGKLAKLHREGGTLKYTSPNATVNTYDVLVQDGFDPIFDHLHYLGGVTSCQFSLTCQPYGRGPEQDLGDNTETTLPALVFTEASIPGDVPALGRLVIDNDSSADWLWLAWGLESRYYSSSANAALFYEAETRTALGTATATAGPSGASGGGSNTVFQGTLTPTYQALLSTQASGGGAHLSHVGSFRVFARCRTVTANSADVSVALQWGVGDFRRSTINDPFTLENTVVHEDKWVLADLGIVTIPPVVTGTQRWEGRLIAKGNPGDDLYVDYLLFMPVAEGYGEATAITQLETPTSFSARDEFDQAAGALTGQTAPVGGVWAGAGDADDFSVETSGKTAQRTAVSDATFGRFAVSGVAAMTTQGVQIDFKLSDASAATVTGSYFGALLRYVDTSNFLVCRVSPFGPSTPSTLVISSVVAGSSSALNFTGGGPIIQAATWYRIVATADTLGRAYMWFGPQDGPLKLYLQSDSTALATGGALASGKPGFNEFILGSTAFTRNFDNFMAYVPSPDAALFAGQSLEVRHNQANREDSTGAIWQGVSSYVGDYLLVPPSGAEARSTRIVVKPCRLDPRVLQDPAIDDISARLYVIPRYLGPPA